MPAGERCRRAVWCVLLSRGGLAGASPVWVMAKQPSSWWPAEGETQPSKRHDKVPSGGERPTGPQHQANPVTSSSPPAQAGQAGAEPCTRRRRPMEGAKNLEARRLGTRRGSGGGTVVQPFTEQERSVSTPVSTRPQPATLRCPAAIEPITGGSREPGRCRAEVGGGSISDDRRGQHNPPQRRASSQARLASRERPWDCRKASHPSADGGQVHERHARLGLLANTGGSVECAQPTAWGKAG